MCVPFDRYVSEWRAHRVRVISYADGAATRDAARAATAGAAAVGGDGGGGGARPLVVRTLAGGGGGGAPGFVDGAPDDARFREPKGLAIGPDARRPPPTDRCVVFDRYLLFSRGVGGAWAPDVCVRRAISLDRRSGRARLRRGRGEPRDPRRRPADGRRGHGRGRRDRGPPRGSERRGAYELALFLTTTE